MARITRLEAAQVIELFVAGTSSDPWDWDDFTSVRYKDPVVEEARRECLEVFDRFPGPEGHYCNDEGMKYLLSIAQRLRAYREPRLDDTLPRMYKMSGREWLATIGWGLIGPSFALVLTVLTVTFDQPVAYQIALGVVTAGFFILFAYLGFSNRWWTDSFEVNPTAIKKISANGNVIEGKWQDLESLECNPWAELRFRDGSIITIPSNYTFADNLVNDISGFTDPKLQSVLRNR
jgi:hypothetical protein